jgi:hypothetical protein
VTSERLRLLLERELSRLHAHGERRLVEEFLALDHGAEIPRLPRYVEECRRVARLAEERTAHWIGSVLRYLAARAEAFALDRPGAAFQPLVTLLVELESGAERRQTLAQLVELELWRAAHKIDAPGYRESIEAGLVALWPRLVGDLGPRTELLDVLWRTGYWCRDAAMMARTRALAAEEPRALRFTAGYWRARERALEAGPGAALRERQEGAREAAELLVELIAEESARQGNGSAFADYVQVELARNEAESGDPAVIAAAAARLARVAAGWSEVPDPMLRWDHAVARAAVARARGDAAEEFRSWQAALRAVEGLGTARLEAEFALAVATCARAPATAAVVPAMQRAEAFAAARARLVALLPTLRSRADLEEAVHALPGLCS